MYNTNYSTEDDCMSMEKLTLILIILIYNIVFILSLYVVNHIVSWIYILDTRFCLQENSGVACL